MRGLLKSGFAIALLAVVVPVALLACGSTTPTDQTGEQEAAATSTAIPQQPQESPAVAAPAATPSPLPTQDAPTLQASPTPVASIKRPAPVPPPTRKRTNGVTASSVSTNGAQRSFTGGRFALILDGAPTARFVKSVKGGIIKAKVATHQLGRELIAKKSLSAIFYEPFTIEVGMGMSEGFYDWMNLSFKGQAEIKTGAILAADFDYKAMSIREFQDALITEVTFPALDGSSKDPAFMTVKIDPERIVYKSADDKLDIQGAVSTASNKWIASNFRIELGDLPTGRVAKIDSFTWKQSVVKDEVGQFREPTLEPTGIEMPNLTLTISMADIEPWQQWHKDFVIDGKSTDEDELSGSITWLGPDLKEELARIDFFNVGIIALDLEQQEANKDAIVRFTVELYVEQMSFEYTLALAGSVGVPPPPVSQPPSVKISQPPDVIGPNVTIGYTLFDSTSDLASIQVSFSVDGGRSFQSATSAKGSEGTQSLETSPSGTAHRFLWNAVRDLGEKQADGIVIRVTPSDSEEGQSAPTAPLFYHPLRDAAADACRIPDARWKLNADTGDALSKLLNTCQLNLLASLETGVKELGTVIQPSLRVAAPTVKIDKVTDLLPDFRRRIVALQDSAASVRITRSDTSKLSDSLSSTEAHIKDLEQALSAVGDDAQLANIDLQAALQKVQQVLQTMSNVSKMLHDISMAIVRKIG